MVVSGTRIPRGPVCAVPWLLAWLLSRGEGHLQSRANQEALPSQLTGPGLGRGVKLGDVSQKLLAALFFTVKRKPLWRKGELSQHSGERWEEWQSPAAFQSWRQCPWKSHTASREHSLLIQIKPTFFFFLSLLRLVFYHWYPAQAYLKQPCWVRCSCFYKHI